MTDPADPPSDTPSSFSADYVDALRRESDQRLIRAELRAAALGAGMIDPADVVLLDVAKASLDKDAKLALPDGFFDQARRAKPYLFAPRAVGSLARSPAAEAQKPRKATDMSVDEWKSARAELLKRS